MLSERLHRCKRLFNVYRLHRSYFSSIDSDSSATTSVELDYLFSSCKMASPPTKQGISISSMSIILSFSAS